MASTGKNWTRKWNNLQRIVPSIGHSAFVPSPGKVYLHFCRYPAPWFHVRVVAALASRLMTMRQEYYDNASFETITGSGLSKNSLSEDQLRRVETLGKELARLKLELERLLSKVQRNESAY